MDGIHDLGGRQGFGPVPRDERVFHEPWEARVFGLLGPVVVAAGFNADAFRHVIERIEPSTYLTVGYFGRWLLALETMLVEGGVLGAGELEQRAALLAGMPLDVHAAPPVRTTDASPATSSSAIRPAASAPRFAIGDRVRVVEHRPPGHTRLPAYVRGRLGRVALVNGAWVYPDTHAHGRGDQPTWVYNVRFEAAELWGDGDLGHRDAVHVDCFEPYLEAADA